MSDIKSFTNMDKKANVQFIIDNDVFEAVGVAPAMAILDVSAVNKAEDMDKIRIILSFLDLVLLPECAEVFADRLSSATNPISIDQAASVAVWLMEEAYAPERPTEAPSSSENGSGSIGASSTDGAQPKESTSEPLIRRVL